MFEMLFLVVFFFGLAAGYIFTIGAREYKENKKRIAENEIKIQKQLQEIEERMESVINVR